MPTWPLIRIVAAALVGIETAIALFYLFIFNQPGNSDPLGSAIAQGVTMIVLALFVVFVLPALVLVLRNTHLKLALALALAAILAAAAAFVLA